MQTTDTLNANPAMDWWISAHPIFVNFMRYIETPLTVENAAIMAREIRDLYEAIGEIYCPQEVDDVYDHFTLALISMFLSFEAAGYGNWKEAELRLGRAVTEWIYTKSACRKAGIGGIQ
jgi:hypothetical protein